MDVQVAVPCCVVQSLKDLAVPVQVAEYLQRNLGGQTSIEILQTEGHLPHLSSPEIVIPVLQRCISSPWIEKYTSLGITTFSLLLSIWAGIRENCSMHTMSFRAFAGRECSWSSSEGKEPQPSWIPWIIILCLRMLVLWMATTSTSSNWKQVKGDPTCFVEIMLNV